MTQRQDVTLPTLLLASMTVYGFLLVWAQNDTIELTTTIGDHRSPMPLVGFNIVTGGNVSIELVPWRSTSIVPVLTTPVQDKTGNKDNGLTTATSLNGATIPLPTAAADEGEDDAATITSGTMTDAKVSPAITHTPGTSPGTTGNANIIPRSIKRSRAATNSTGRVSITVKIQSSAPKDEAIKMFMKKACEFFQTLQLEDVHLTLGPDRAAVLCLDSALT